jgi:Fasciclin domain
VLTFSIKRTRMVNIMNRFFVYLSILLVACNAPSKTQTPDPISDPVIVPMSQLFVDAQQGTDFTLFAKAVVLSKAVPQLNSLASQDYVTTYVPTDTAIRAYLKIKNTSEDAFFASDLSDFIKTHMFLGRDKATLINQSYLSFAGTSLDIEVLNPECLSSSADCQYQINQVARVVSFYIPFGKPYSGGNGSVALIDKVLVQ